MNRVSDFIKQVLQGKSIYRILFNWQVREYCRGLDGVCLDLAAGHQPSYHRYLSLRSGAQLIRSDYDKTKNPDVRADLNRSLPFKDGFADNIFVFNAIYIVKEPEKLCRELFRILKKDGRLYISSPFVFHEVREPDDFRRLTSQGLEQLLKNGGFQNVRLVPFGGHFSAAAHLLHSFFVFNMVRLVVFSAALLLDKLVPSKIRKLHPCPLGYFVINQK